jgi:hypothetical protein
MWVLLEDNSERRAYHATTYPPDSDTTIMRLRQMPPFQPVRTLSTILSTIFWDITPIVSWKSTMFRRNISPQSSASNMPCMISAWRQVLGLFGPENGGDVPPKCRLTFNGLGSVISQLIVLFITIAVRTSDPTTTIQLVLFPPLCNRATVEEFRPFSW